MELDTNTIGAILGVAGTSLTFVYAFLRNVKIDINEHIGRLDKRMDSFESKIISLEERMFWMATGKKLQDAILEERLKEKKAK